MKALLLRHVQILKFVVAGASGAIVEITLFLVLSQYVGLHYLLANLLAISVALVVNYLISFKWVFETGRYSRRTEFLVFVGVSVLALALNQTMMWVLVDNLHVDDWVTGVLTGSGLFGSATLESSGLLLTKVGVIAVVAFANFFSKKYLVFKG